MPPTHYPPELIEAAEKEYPYYDVQKLPKMAGAKIFSDALVNDQREAFLKGLSKCKVLKDALNEIMMQVDIGCLVFDIADKALANFHKPVTNKTI